MSAASNYLEDKLLDHVLNFGNGSLTVGSGSGFAPPSVVYVALFTANGSTQKTALAAALEANTSGTDADTKFGYYEVQTSGSTNYARQSISFGAAGSSGGNATGTIKTDATVSFPVAGADYQSAGSTGNVVTHIAIMDASTSGNVLFYGALTTEKTVSNGDQFTISSGNLSISLA
tara:strand:+ start:388 stop:912 length:525 start_codon:yes stop_codon:yes gene_type:complete